MPIVGDVIEENGKLYDRISTSVFNACQLGHQSTPEYIGLIGQQSIRTCAA